MALKDMCIAQGSMLCADKAVIQYRGDFKSGSVGGQAPVKWQVRMCIEGSMRSMGLNADIQRYMGYAGEWGVKD